MPSAMDGDEFINFAYDRRSRKFSSISREYESTWWYEQGTEWVEGTFNQPVSFDGYTCTDDREAAYFYDDESYAFVDVEAG